MLTSTQVKQAKSEEKAYRLADSGGLFLWVTPAGGKYWRIKYRWNKKQMLLSIGAFPIMNLAEARDQLFNR